MKKYFKQLDFKKLLRKRFMLEFFNSRLRELGEIERPLEKIKIYPIKDHFGDDFTHIVCFYKLYFAGGEKPLNIIGAAHSDGSRAKIYKRQKYIYKHGFDSKEFRVPRPLFYEPSFKAMFYVALPGGNLYSRICRKDYQTVFWAMPRVAVWLAKFHKLKMNKSDYLKNQLSLKTLDPVDILGRKSELALKYKKEILGLYKELKKFEKDILSEPRRHSTVVHGDMHAENVIVSKKGEQRSLAVIDFSEIRVAPPIYDVASFIQQIESMSKGHFSGEQIKKLQQEFLRAYLATSGKKLTASIKNQLHLYIAWVSLRGAIFFIGAGKEHKIREALEETRRHLRKIKK